MRVKCFWVEIIEPRVHDWEGGIGRPRYRRLDNGEELRGELPAGALYVLDPERKYRNSRGSRRRRRGVRPAGWPPLAYRQFREQLHEAG